MDAKETVTLVGVILTFIVGSFNLVGTLKNNKRTTFVNTITSERVKWMGQLKDMISEFLSITKQYSNKGLKLNEDYDRFSERLIYLQHRIKLHLNRLGSTDREINRFIADINEIHFSMYESKLIYETPHTERFHKLYTSDKWREILEDMYKEVDKHKNTSKVLSRDTIENFYNEMYQEITRMLIEDYGVARTKLLNEKLDVLVDTTSEYLKEEWERVKREADKGKFIK